MGITEANRVTDAGTVKQAIVDLLKGDADIQTLLGKDRQGEVPVYFGFENILEKTHFPCITVEDITEIGEVSGLADGYNGSNVKEWYHSVIQIDCWAKSAEKRDSIASQVKKTILKGKSTLRSSDVIMIQEPSVVIVNEPYRKPAIFRKCLRYRVFYIFEVLVS